MLDIKSVEGIPWDVRYAFHDLTHLSKIEGDIRSLKRLPAFNSTRFNSQFYIGLYWTWIKSRYVVYQRKGYCKCKYNPLSERRIRANLNPTTKVLNWWFKIDYLLNLTGLFILVYLVSLRLGSSNLPLG